MKKTLKITLPALLFASGMAIAGGAPISGPTGPTGSASFTAQDRTYPGTYWVDKKLIAVDIDGSTYKGHYTSNLDDMATRSSSAVTGSWGRAFLFASSAKTLQCQLDAGFPDASGRCLDAQGRQYLMKAGTLRMPNAAPK